MILVRGNLADFEVFFFAHQDRIKASFDEVKTALQDWQLWRLEEGEPLAVIAEKNGHAHIAAYNGSIVGTRRIKWALDRLKIDHTTVGEGFRQGHSLARRLGFHVEMTEKGVTHYVRCI